jgi:hypothetical protein
MELCSPESIRELIAGFGNPTLVPRRHSKQTAAMPTPKPLHLRQSKRGLARPAVRNSGMPCRCGHCRLCLDNARWERIYAEKFADPTYYTRRVTHMASPLTSI